MQSKSERWRIFPTLRWAWPAAGLDQLLTAAICPDESRAHQALVAWLRTHDIDEVQYRDHRLLAAIADRFGSTLATHSAGPRLLGLQRQLWTRSRLAISQGTDALRRMKDAGVSVMLLKGAARIAAERDAVRARMAHDIDLLVPPQQFSTALDVLLDTGWTASSGESSNCLRRLAPGIRAINFSRDRWGNIDLHQWIYSRGKPIVALESSLWDHAVPASFFGVPVLIPAETDRAALAVVNSGLDAHAHSDWLVDCAGLLIRPLDWDRLLTTLRDSQGVVPAQVAVSYLAQHLGSDIPAEFVAKLLSDRAGGTFRRLLGLLLSKPRANWTPLACAARGVAKQFCRLTKQHVKLPGTILRGGFLPAADEVDFGELAMQHLLSSAELEGPLRIQLDLVVPLSGTRRRIAFELNTPQQHIARLHARTIRQRQGNFIVRFDGVVELPSGTDELWIESRPGRQLRDNRNEGEAARYGALPCKVNRFQLANA